MVRRMTPLEATLRAKLDILPAFWAFSRIGEQIWRQTMLGGTEQIRQTNTRSYEVPDRL